MEELEEYLDSRGLSVRIEMSWSMVPVQVRMQVFAIGEVVADASEIFVEVEFIERFAGGTRSRRRVLPPLTITTVLSY
jgi:hypothetical protein